MFRVLALHLRREDKGRLPGAMVPRDTFQPRTIFRQGEPVLVQPEDPLGIVLAITFHVHLAGLGSKAAPYIFGPSLPELRPQIPGILWGCLRKRPLDPPVHGT